MTYFKQYASPILHCFLVQLYTGASYFALIRAQSDLYLNLEVTGIENMSKTVRLRSTRE